MVYMYSIDRLHLVGIVNIWHIMNHVRLVICTVTLLATALSLGRLFTTIITLLPKAIINPASTFIKLDAKEI